MSSLFVDLLTRLAWSSVALAGAGILALVALRVLCVRSPRIHGTIWWMVLLYGLAVAHITLEIPWYPRAAPESEYVSEGLARPLPIDSTVDPHVPAATFQSRQTSPLILPVEPTTHWLSSRRLPHLLGALWLAGACLILARWTMSYFTFRWRRRTWPCDRPEWNEQWNQLLNSVGIKRSIPIYLGYADGPALSWQRSGYRLILPIRVWRNLSYEQRQLVLRHELAHLQRGDIWKLMLARLLALPHWFNPMAWRALAQIELAAECACDIAAGQETPTVYATTLLAIRESCTTVPAWTTAGGGSCLALRVKQVLSTSDQKDSRMKTSLLLSAFVIAIVAIVFRIDLVAQAAPHPTETFESADSENSPTEEAALSKMRGLVQQDPIPFDKIEAIAARASTPNTGRLYAEVARTYHENGAPRRTIVWAQMALGKPLPPTERLQMYQYWGQAAYRHNPTAADQKAASFVWPVVLGLVEASQHRIPIRGVKGAADQESSQTEEERQDDLKSARDAIVGIMANATTRPRFQPTTLDPALKRLLFSECFSPGGTHAEKTPPWVSQGRTFACTFSIEYSKLLNDLEPVMHAACGVEGWIDEVLEALKKDPDGPQVDFKRDLLPYLGRRTIFAMDYQEPTLGWGDQILLAIEVTDSDRVAAFVDRLFSVDPDYHQITRDGENIWSIKTPNANAIDNQAICVAHNHVFISNLDLLVETLRRKK
jgi:beta-lactamase regulating signal transducer with metallopeptidase domain